MYSKKGIFFRQLLASLGISASPSRPYYLDQIVKQIKANQINIDLARYGSKNDGGYLIPSSVEGIDLCVSPGVSDNCSFENDLYARFGCDVILIDPTIEQLPRTNFDPLFIKKYLRTSGEKSISLEEIVNKFCKNYSHVLLQCDIEGAEWSTILSCPRYILSKIDILIIEFHYFDKVIDDITGQIFNDVFSKIFLDFKIAHMHPNNTVNPINLDRQLVYPVFEATFVNKNINIHPSVTRKFGPHPFDSDCSLNQKSVVLDKIYINQ